MCRAPPPLIRAAAVFGGVRALNETALSPSDEDDGDGYYTEHNTTSPWSYGMYIKYVTRYRVLLACYMHLIPTTCSTDEDDGDGYYTHQNTGHIPLSPSRRRGQVLHTHKNSTRHISLSAYDAEDGATAHTKQHGTYYSPRTAGTTGTGATTPKGTAVHTKQNDSPIK